MTGMRIPRRQRRAIHGKRWERLGWLAAQQIERAHQRSNLGRALKALLDWKPLPAPGPKVTVRQTPSYALPSRGGRAEW